MPRAYSSSSVRKSYRARPRTKKSRKRGTKSRRVNRSSRGQRASYTTKIESPESGRWIMIGGPAYRALLDMGFTEAQLKRRPHKRGRRAKRRYSQSSGPKGSKGRPTKSQRKMRVSKRSRSSTRGRGRGSRTSGWSKVAPRRGRPRHALKKKCKSKCFLDSEHEAFPICASLSSSGGKCEIDCRGVKSAYVRAKQWGYPKIAKAADKLYREKCSRSRRSHRKRRR